MAEITCLRGVIWKTTKKGIMRSHLCKVGSKFRSGYIYNMEVEPREIRNYLRADNRIPFEEWFISLKDSKTKKKIQIRLDRLQLGNFGDCKSVGEGVFELRIDYGPGYRVYFGQIGLTIVLLLCGGDKSTQEQDIKEAQTYWRDYEKRENTDK
jgi:putative addiction module killer protein